MMSSATLSTDLDQRLPVSDNETDPGEILKTHESAAASNRGILENPPLFVRGAGARVWDSEGRPYVDFSSGSAVTSAGHDNPEISSAVSAQLKTGLLHVGPSQATPAKARVIEAILGLAPRGLQRVHLTVTGGEAVETALKVVRYKTGRQTVIAFWGAFHGRTMGALALTGQRVYRDPFFPSSQGVVHFHTLTLIAIPLGLQPSAGKRSWPFV